MERNTLTDKDVYTVFIVDDVKSICNSIRRELTMSVREREDISFRIVDEQDPELAVQKILEKPPDLLISDIKMPYLTGDKLVAEVKKQLPNLPTIVITGFATKENILSVYRADPHVVIIGKPWEEEKLVGAVMSLLKIPALPVEKK